MNAIAILLKESGARVVIATIAGLISGACSAGAISLISRGASGEGTATIQPSSLMVEFIVLALAALISGLVAQFLLSALSQSAIYNFRLKLSQSILSAPLSRLEQLGTGSLLATLTGDVATLSNTIVIVPFLCIDLAIVLGCLIYLAIVSGIVFAISVVLMVVGILTIQLVVVRANQMFRQARQEEDKLLNYFRAITDGIKELKLNQWRREAFINEELKPVVGKLERENVRALKLFAIANGLGQTIFFLTVGIILFILPQILQIPARVLASFVLTITYLMLPFGNIIERLPMLLRANVSIKKIQDMGLQLTEKIEENTFDRSLAFAKTPHIKLNDIEYTYGGEDSDRQFKLDRIDLTIAPGEIVFIVGGNGSGKSTLAKILTGLYVPDRGSICLNDRPIDDPNREWYRQHFAAVFSDFYLFDRLLGINPEGIDDRAQIYLERLQLQHKVSIQNGRLSTINLSQGQRKRLALLLAYLDERPIYVFDEWAADQDPVFREVFYHQLLPQLQAQGRSIVVISHDDRYFQIADRLIKLDYGKVQN
jgi:putative pyoverdin transport system ATP-binding/permease protein